MQTEPWLSAYDPTVPHHLNYDPISIVDLFRNTVEKNPDDTMLVDGDLSFSFRQVDELSTRVCIGLTALGCSFDEPVGLIMPNLPQFVISFIGILKFGGVVVALNPTYSARELKFHIVDSGVRTVITVRPLEGVLESIQDETHLKWKIFTNENDQLEMIKQMVGNYYLSPAGSTLSFLELLQVSGSSKKIVAPSTESRAIFQYSGGTTGTPKAAIGTHRNLIANVTQFAAWLSGMPDRQHPILAAIPLFHVYGMVLCMLLAIKMDVPLILVHSARDIAGIFKAIQSGRPGVFPSVPTQIQAILSHPDLPKYSEAIREIQVCISGSAPLRVETKAEFEKLIDGVLVEGFGMSEAPTATHCNPINGTNKPGSIGIPLPDVTCKIVDPVTSAVKTHPCDAGELLIKGPQIMSGYLNRDEETRQILRDGWLHTGDVAVMDEDGYFYIIGREKDLIKVGGLQVWPQEIEEVVRPIEGIKEVAAAGVPDRYSGEKPILWIVPAEGASIDVELIKKHCRQNLAPYKVPAEVFIVSSLPRTTVGKLLRRELISSYLDRGQPRSE